jgi:aminoglycoside phosphotransferase family enzyme/predicted kinase
MAPDAPGRPAVAVAETHTAAVVFFGDRAYKVKKPVVMPFLDFSTVERRRAVCEREVALNRRLAPDVYLGVGEVRGPTGEPPEPLVVMRRMPDDRRLSALVQTGVPVGEHLRRLARLLSAFHASPVTRPTIPDAGGVEDLRGNWVANTEQLRPFAGAVIDGDVVDDLERLALRYLGGRGPLFAARAAAGLIRDGHGDLLADDIFCLDDGPRILDCIEFDDRLRHGDVLADVAFLAMDLERLGASADAAGFLRWYEEFSGHHHPSSLVDHHIAYRAQVRAKVSCLRHDQGDPGAADAARSLLALSLEHLSRARVRLVLVGGLPGTGKSTLARGLAEDLGWLVLSSDELRKELVGLDTRTPAPAPFGEGLYSPGHTDATYGELLRRAGEALSGGSSVILDASWSDGRWRERAKAVATTTASDLVALRCAAPLDVAAARLERRRVAGPSSSDADAAIALAMAEHADPWPEAVDLRTDRPPDEVLRAGVRVLGGTNASGLVSPGGARW